LLDLVATAASCSTTSIAPNTARVITPPGWARAFHTWDDVGVTSRPEDRPPASSKGIHIPPEDAAMLAMLFLEVAGALWRRERSKWNMRKVTAQRSLEYALGNEGGFTALLRQSRTKRRAK
jgi:hypothetical protein